MWPICILNNYLHGKRLTREKAGSVQFADNGKSGVLMLKRDFTVLL